MLIGLTLRRMRRRRSRVDRAASYMGRGRDVEDLSRKSVTAKAERLGVTGAPGVPIGRTVAAGQQLYGSWEGMHIDIWGPRTGKTTSRAVPAILDAPGSVLVTSNKRDVVDATRDVRSEAGPVWVFDPQSIALEEPTWWWNPLSYVTDEVRAAKLAEHFASGSRDPGAKTDAYFDPAGQDLLAGLLLAAALDHRPITDVYTWLTRPTDETAVDVLREHDFALTADQVAGVVSASEKQRGGIFGTAMQMASCLTNRQVARWVTPQGAADPRKQFSPDDFVRADGGTLYSLSKEGRGTAGPLVTALTVAVVEAAEELASRSAGGRLRTPLLGVLDEAANVCRWRALPYLYSHYGSRGIVLMTILQSWSQGVEVWVSPGCASSGAPRTSRSTVAASMRTPSWSTCRRSSVTTTGCPPRPLRQDAATGMSVWWRDHADHHMAVLMDPDGPFATATEGEENKSKRGEPLPYVAPPEGMFPDVREETDGPPVDDAH